MRTTWYPAIAEDSVRGAWNEYEIRISSAAVVTLVITSRASPEAAAGTSSGAKLVDGFEADPRGPGYSRETAVPGPIAKAISTVNTRMQIAVALVTDAFLPHRLAGRVLLERSYHCCRSVSIARRPAGSRPSSEPITWAAAVVVDAIIPRYACVLWAGP
jgi:hypothetical protein